MGDGAGRDSDKLATADGDRESLTRGPEAGTRTRARTRTRLIKPKQEKVEESSIERMSDTWQQRTNEFFR